MAIAEITARLGAIKAAGEAIGGVLKADKALGQAELKLKLADAMVALAEARTSILDAQAAVDAKDGELGQLRDALEHKAKVVRRVSAYYDVDSQGRPMGHGYCMRCWEADHKLRHLAYGKMGAQAEVECPACRAKYPYRGVLPLRYENDQVAEDRA